MQRRKPLIDDGGRHKGRLHRTTTSLRRRLAIKGEETEPDSEPQAALEGGGVAFGSGP